MTREFFVLRIKFAKNLKFFVDQRVRLKKLFADVQLALDRLNVGLFVSERVAKRRFQTGTIAIQFFSNLVDFFEIRQGGKNRHVVDFMSEVFV